MQTNTARVAAPRPNPSAPAQDNRLEKRLNVAVPVKIFTDPASQDYYHCCTYEISIHGARLMASAGIQKVGQFVWLQRHNRRARYKVTWIGEPGTDNAGQFGVESLEPGNVIWENELKMRIMQS